MKLIGAGLPRTATLSQKVALEVLGVGPCYHMVNVLGDLELVPSWRRALGGDGRWDGIFRGFDATVDWPGAYFYRELIDVYPDAKVLLSVRDGHAWARSMRSTIWAVLYGDNVLRHLSDARADVDAGWQGYVEMMKEMWRRSGLIAREDTTDDEMSDAMGRYHDEVRRTVPSDRLLVWSADEGWEPLCQFLDVPVPDMPFPRLNDSKEFTERIVDGALLALQEWRAHEAPVVVTT
jgi:hypothetical protein